MQQKFIRCKGPEHRKRTQKKTKQNLPLLTSRIFSTSGQWSSCYVHDWLLLIISMEYSHSWKANSSSVCQQIPCIYGTWRFITIFTTAHHLSLPIHPISFKPILIVHSQLRLSLPSGLFSWGFITKTVYAIFVFPSHATSPAQVVLLGLIIWIKYLVRNTNRRALHHAIFSNLLLFPPS
jgi:hypothetical protein